MDPILFLLLQEHQDSSSYKHRTLCLDQGKDCKKCSNKLVWINLNHFLCKKKLIFKLYKQNTTKSLIVIWLENSQPETCYFFITRIRIFKLTHWLQLYNFLWLDPHSWPCSSLLAKEPCNLAHLCLLVVSGCPQLRIKWKIINSQLIILYNFSNYESHVLKFNCNKKNYVA